LLAKCDAVIQTSLQFTVNITQKLMSWDDFLFFFAFVTFVTFLLFFFLVLVLLSRLLRLFG